MRHSAKLTQESVDAAAPRQREYIIIDDHVQGLALRVRPNGSKTWQLRWREDGKLKRVTMGDATNISLADARRRTSEPFHREDNAVANTAQPTVLFGDLAQAFLEAKERGGLKSQSPRMYIRSQLIPAFGHVPATRLTTPRIAAWFHEYSSTRPGGANEALALLAGVLRYGREHGLIPPDLPNPCAPIRKNPKRNAGRILSADGLAALGRVLKRPDWRDRDAADAIQLILLTGCRSGEIIRLRWAEVERDHLKLSQTKTGLRDVQLSKSARRILAQRKKERLGLFVFPSPRTISQSRKDFKSHWIRIKARAGIDPKLRLHDLRHSYASHAVMSGETLAMTGQLLGHRSPISTERYAHYDGAFLSSAAERVTALVAHAMK